ncbi:MAG: hypothetical protein QXG63_05045 [Nitrososphaerales archaeon]
MSKIFKKVESVSDFLARGGKITVLPTKSLPTTENVVTSTKAGPVNVLTLDEAELFYSEPQPVKVKKTQKVQPAFDINALPASLKEKLLSKIKHEVEDGE